jgi:hypothetical protein
MTAGPIDSFDGAEAYFTFGADSAGMWIFLILGLALFVFVGIRAAQIEAHGFEEIRAAGAAAEEPAP